MITLFNIRGTWKCGENALEMCLKKRPQLASVQNYVRLRLCQFTNRERIENVVFHLETITPILIRLYCFYSSMKSLLTQTQIFLSVVLLSRLNTSIFVLQGRRCRYTCRWLERPVEAVRRYVCWWLTTCTSNCAKLKLIWSRKQGRTHTFQIETVKWRR